MKLEQEVDVPNIDVCSYWLCGIREIIRPLGEGLETPKYRKSWGHKGFLKLNIGFSVPHEPCL